MSSGGLFTYQMGQALSHIFASVIPVEGAPMLGFNIVPKHPISLLDFRGLSDTEVPGNVSGSYNGLIGPDNSTWSADGFYYTPLDNITAAFKKINKCDGKWTHWSTKYDGTRDFYCVKPYGNCSNGIDIIRCSGQWGHTWPLWKVQPTAFPNLVWQFISTHPKPN